MINSFFPRFLMRYYSQEQCPGVAPMSKQPENKSHLYNPCYESSIVNQCTETFQEPQKPKISKSPNVLRYPTNPGLAWKLKFWRILSLCTFPVIAVTAIWCLAGSAEENKKPRPEYLPYPAMYIKRKPFPWGDGNHSFFHNPERNAVPPHGYEVPDPNAVHQRHSTKI